MIYPDTFEHKIGFDAVRRHLLSRCLSDLGKRKCEEMGFSADYEEVAKMLGETGEMVRILTSGEDFPLGSVHDVTPQLRTIRVPGTHISEPELLRLRNSLATMAAIATFFRSHRNDDGMSLYPRLDAMCAGLTEFPQTVREIDRVIDKFGHVRDTASPELSRVRNQLSAMSGSIAAAMRRVIARAVKEGILDADVSASMRDGRPVIPVAPMHKRSIPGIVHDESASGKTYFIEPSEVVETSNRMRELQIEERREVLRILVSVADGLRPLLPGMLDSFDVLAAFDFVNAKARFAIDCGAAEPHLHRDMQLELYHACHPILKLSLEAQGKQIVPLDIELTPQKRILVISGPNAGGKSVTLKTVAMIQYMTQCGLLPAVYENSHIGVVESVFIDIGDDQSMEDDLSTYSSHLRNMKYFVTNGNARTLVLIDEFGSGTEPQIGGAIAQAVLSQFVELGMWGVITTHFQNLKHFADVTEGLVNGSMLYDRQKMQPLFRLLIGNAGSSFALEIARKTGLPEKIIKQAEEIVGSDYINLDKYLLDIARDKRYWENKRMSIRQKEKKVEALIEKFEADTDKLREQRREIIESARTQAKEIIDKSNAAVERTIHDIKEANAERERTIEARQRLEKEKAEIGAERPDEHPLLRKGRRHGGKKPAAGASRTSEDKKAINVGDNVLLDGAGTVGKVLEIQGKNAVVAFGQLKTTVKTDRLKPTLRQVSSGATKGATFISAATSDSIRERQLQFHPEIDVRGMRVDEALQAVTYFIDDALQFNAGRVRILHGTGTGALREAIRDYLSTIAGVRNYADEDVRFGGAGITVVEL